MFFLASPELPLAHKAPLCQLYRRSPVPHRKTGEGHAGWVSGSTFPCLGALVQLNNLSNCT